MSRRENRYSLSKTGFVVVNLNGKRYLGRCLESIFSQKSGNISVVLVDNGSGDGSVEWVKKNYSRVEIIENKKNLGFAKANNIGIDFLLKNYPEVEFLALVNNDAYLEKVWLENIVEIMAKDKKIGAVVGKVLLASEPGRLDSAGVCLKGICRFVNRGFRQKDSGQYEVEEEVLVCGAAAAVYRRRMLEVAKLDDEYFDSDFFAYYEDVDLGIRARLLGFKSFYTPEAVAYHHFASTSKKMPSGFKEYLSKRNRLWVLVKNYPNFLLPKALFCLLIPTNSDRKKTVVEGFSPLCRDSINPPRYDRGSISTHLRSYLASLRPLKKMLRKRKIIQSRKTISNEEIKEWFKKFQYQS